MIKPVGFSGLHLNLKDNLPVLKKTINGEASAESFERNIVKINNYAGDNDVYLKASFYDPRKEENPNMSKNYDVTDKFVKLQITDKNDEVLAEVKTCTDEPQGTHEYCVANKLEILAMKFAVAAKNVFQK